VRTSLLSVSVLTLLLLADAAALLGQERCATNVLQKLQNRSPEADRRFEDWIKTKAKVSAQERKEQQGFKRTQATYRIPVVVHIIHNGEGHATNIPDAQVISQIRVLNDDFNRNNTDATQTPAEFADDAGSLDVEFVLAKRTPEGLPTNGIVRVHGPKTLWKVSDNYQLKSLSYWPAEDYLNIWVCNLETYLGYAQFPESDLVNGLENSSTNRLTDGVVISFDAFGSLDDGSFALDPKYTRGRTSTHEVGHYLGLRHISGDDEGECGNDGDYVDDTPDQAGPTYNCPSHPQLSCTITSMFQNYLDYTNDVCMNLFTKGQAERMAVILDNSPRRKSLTLSQGATEPEPVANDLGIKTILSPSTGECAGEIAPSIELRNYGSNPITSAQVVVEKDGIPIQTLNLALNLDPFESSNISFDPLSMGGGSSIFSFRIVKTNGTTDGSDANDNLQRTVLVPATVATPVIETFDEIPAEWTSRNPDGVFSWELANVPVGINPNTALEMNFYDYEDGEGEIDLLISPVIDLSDVPVALLLFDVAHARYKTSNDGLKVYLLSECNSDINSGVLIYDKSGSTLATTADSNTAFVPTTANQWRTEAIDFAAYAGQKVQLAFVGVNDWGNNLYLDNVRLLTNSFVNLTLVKVINPPPIACNAHPQPKLLVRNSGTTISSFEISYSINGTSTTQTIQTSIAGGGEAEIALPEIDLKDGKNELIFSLEDPDGLPDIDPTDNTINLVTTFSNATGNIPFRQNFESPTDTWTITSPDNGLLWNSVKVGEGNAIFYDGYNNTTIGSQSWLVSPIIDLSGVTEANLYFDVSYALRGTISDKLEVRAAMGCNEPFDTVLDTYSDSELSDFSKTIPWIPDGPGDWRNRHINLASILGQSEVRIAFVAINNNGNNLYLDSIELFLADEFSRVEVDGMFNLFPNPSLEGQNPSIAFNFSELQDITIQIVDNLGKIIYSENYEDVLNQIYELPTKHYRTGLYHVRVESGGKIYSSKLLVGR
jgi:hypothetical protein